MTRVLMIRSCSRLLLLLLCKEEQETVGRKRRRKRRRWRRRRIVSIRISLNVYVASRGLKFVLGVM